MGLPRRAPVGGVSLIVVFVSISYAGRDVCNGIGGKLRSCLDAVGGLGGGSLGIWGVFWVCLFLRPSTSIHLPGDWMISHCSAARRLISCGGSGVSFYKIVSPADAVEQVVNDVDSLSPGFWTRWPALCDPVCGPLLLGTSRYFSQQIRFFHVSCWMAWGSPGLDDVGFHSLPLWHAHIIGSAGWVKSYCNAAPCSSWRHALSCLSGTGV